MRNSYENVRLCSASLFVGAGLQTGPGSGVTQRAANTSGHHKVNILPAEQGLYATFGPGPVWRPAPTFSFAVASRRIMKTWWWKLIQKSLVQQGRIVRFSLIISDAPGSLARLLERIASYRASILDVTHDRMSSRVGLGNTGVEVTLETRGHPHIAEITRGLRSAGYNPMNAI